MALSFLYFGFVRLLQLTRLCRRGQEDLAIEIVMLGHEVTVLRRQIVRPVLQPSDGAVLADLSRLLSLACWKRSSSSQERCFGGIEVWGDGSGRTRTDGLVAPDFQPTLSP